MILRELARSVGERLGQRVSFAPVVAGMGVGNGVHVHMSLVDAGGEPVMYDAAGPGGLRRRAAASSPGSCAICRRWWR